MFNIMIMIETVSDRRAFESTVDKKKIHLLPSSPSYSNYIKALQYMPDCVVLEIPKKANDQFHFIQMLKQHHDAKKIPIFCFGDPLSESIKNGMLKIGAHHYLERPFNIQSIIQSVHAICQETKTGKPTPVKRYTISDDQLKQLLSPEIPANQKIDLMVKQVYNLLAFPFTILKLVSLLNSNRSSVNDLVKVIATDPTISATLLKICNSVHFAASHRRISSLKDAVVRIGFNETRRVIMGMAVMNLFDNDNSKAGFDRVKFWIHCLTSAIISQKIAKSVNDIESDEAFLAGLLHDFGIILLDEFFPTLFDTILERTIQEGIRFIDAERACMGVTHLDLTEALFEKWKIPESIQNSVINYQKIGQRSFIEKHKDKALTLCTGVSNTITKSLMFGSGCDQYIIPLDNWMLESINMPFGIKQGFREEISQELKLFQDLVNVDFEEASKSTTALSSNDIKINICLINLSKSVFIAQEAYLSLQGHPIFTPADMEEDSEKVPDLIIINTEPTSTERDIKEVLLKLSDNQESTIPTLLLISQGQHFTNLTMKSFTFSFMDTSSDLRVLDETISKILQGMVVRKRIQPAKDPSPEDKPQDDIATIQNDSILSAVLKSKELCTTKKLTYKEVGLADYLVEVAQKEISENNNLDANWMLQLADFTYQKALLKSSYKEKDSGAKKILSSLNKDQTKKHKDLLSRFND